MSINWRENSRLGADHAKISRAKSLRHDVLGLAGAAIVTSKLTAVDDIRVERISRHAAILLRAYRMPFAESDLAVVAAAGNAGAPALLLAAAQAVRERIARADARNPL